MDFIFNPLTYCQNLALLKDGLVQQVSSSLTTKGGAAFVYLFSAQIWCDLVAMETGGNKIQ